MKKLSAIIITLVLFASQITIVSAQTEPDFNNEGFTIVPATNQYNNGRNFYFELKPGDTVENFIEIRNLANRDENFLLYGSDPTFSAQGTPAYKTRQDGGHAEGQWLQFDEPETVLGPNENKLVRFTVTIPKDTSIGEYRAGITMEKSKQDINNPGITIATRLIIHAKINVTESPNPNAVDTNGFSKQEESQPEPEPVNMRVIYTIISIILFTGSFIALIWITLAERKENGEHVKRKSRTTHKTSTAKKASKKASSRKISKKPTRKTTKKRAKK